MLFDRLKNIGRSYVNDWLGNRDEDLDADVERILREYRRKMGADFTEHAHQEDFRQEPAFNTKEISYYQTLELEPGASFEQVKESYRRLMKKYHPDRFPNDPKRQKTAVELTQKINVAYTYFKKKQESQSR